MKKIAMMSLILLLSSAVFVSCSDPTINDFVNELKSNLPQDLGEGVVLSDARIVDNLFEMEMTSDESGFKLNDPVASEMLPMISETYRDMFLEDEGMSDIFEACAKEGKGFRIVLKGTQSGESMTMLDVSPEELKAKFPPKE